MTRPYCIIGCTRGTGLQIVRHLAARGTPVRCIARDPLKAQNLLPAGGWCDLLPGGHYRPSCRPGLVKWLDAAKAVAFTGRFVLLSGMGSELPSFTGRLLNAIKGNLQRNQRDRDDYLRNSGLDWSIGRGGLLTDGAGGQAAIRITPPVHRLSLLRRLARTDFARALIATADTPAASGRMFDVFNEPGSSPTDEPLTRQFECLRRATGAKQVSPSFENAVVEQSCG